MNRASAILELKTPAMSGAVDNAMVHVAIVQLGVDMGADIVDGVKA